MEKFLTLLFQDPILLISALVLLATIVILLWALNAWRNGDDMADDEEIVHEDTLADDEEDESSGILEARLAEVSSQLGEISARLAAIEKAAEKKPAAPAVTAATSTAAPSSVEIERMIKRLESKIETLSAEKSQLPTDSITRLESRLEGIHRLLIILTEGDGDTTGK